MKLFWEQLKMQKNKTIRESESNACNPKSPLLTSVFNSSVLGQQTYSDKASQRDG